MNFAHLLDAVLMKLPFIGSTSLLLPSKRYVAITLILAQVLKLNKKLHSWKLTSLQRAVQIEQWLLLGWEREKKRLCHISMQVLMQSLIDGSLELDSAVIDYLFDLQALQAEGHHNQVLNHLYGKGEPIFDALVYPDPSILESQQTSV